VLVGPGRPASSSARLLALRGGARSAAERLIRRLATPAPEIPGLLSLNATASPSRLGQPTAAGLWAVRQLIGRRPTTAETPSPARLVGSMTAPGPGLSQADRPRPIRPIVGLDPPTPEPPSPTRLIGTATAPRLIRPQASRPVSQLVGIRPTAPEPPGPLRFIRARLAPGLIVPRARRPVSQLVRVRPTTPEPPGPARLIHARTTPRLRVRPATAARPAISLLVGIRPTAPRMPGPARPVGTASPPRLNRRPTTIQPTTIQPTIIRSTAIRSTAIRPSTVPVVARLGATPASGHVAGISKIARVVRGRPRTQVRPEPGQPAGRELAVRSRTTSAARILRSRPTLPRAMRPGATPAIFLRRGGRARVTVAPPAGLTRVILTWNNVTRVGTPAAALRPAAARIRPAAVVPRAGNRLGRPGIRRVPLTPVPLTTTLMTPPAVLPVRGRGLRLGTGRPSPRAPASRGLRGRAAGVILGRPAGLRLAGRLAREPGPHRPSRCLIRRKIAARA
jgi:hypothetical protein